MYTVCASIFPAADIALLLPRFLVLTRQEVLGAEPVNAARSFAVPLAALLLVWLSAAFS